VLRCTSFWHKPGIDSRAFEANSRALALAPNVGLPGRVWSSGAPLWVDNVAEDETFTRREAAQQAGLRSAFAFPIQSQQNFFGVIEFFLRESQPPDEVLFQMGTAIGIQMGQYIAGKRAEAAVRQSHAREGAILEAALDGIITIDQQGKITEFNRAAEKIFGYQREELIGRHLDDFIILPAERDAPLTGVAHYLATGQGRLLGRRFEVEGVRADGSRFPIEIAVSPIPAEGGPPLFTAFVRDITEHKRAETERAHLLERERQARAAAEEARQQVAFLAEASTILTFSLDYRETLASLVQMIVPALADYCIIDVLENGSLQRVKASHADPEKEVVMQALQSHYPPKLDAPVGVGHVLRVGRSVLVPDISDDQLVAAAQDAEHLRLLRDLGPRSSMMIPLISPSRTLGVITFAITTSARRYDASDLALAEDLTRRAALAADNARLYQEAQEAIKARDRFFSIASHELKTPITTIKGFVDILQRRAVREGGGANPNERALHIIARESSRLNRLIDLLLDLSRIEEDRFRLQVAELDLLPLLVRVIEVTQPSLEGHTLTFRCEADTLPLKGDELRLEQALHNLIQNAIKYSPDGGTIAVHAARRNGQITVSISDEGIGIPTDALPRLFHRFYRGENAEAMGIGGMGMGLYVVRHIVEAHGGTIDVASEEGQGSTFTLTLPTQS
nr:PAS domain S-box protein [Ardenticatenales bacterium]